jgi:RNA polymerase sigma factor (sigma-70 family)
MTSDGELLRRYTETNSEDAFAELARRHLDLVYSAALRQVNGDAHLAQEVAQSVFADLARKAASLVGRQALAGWLYTGAHYAAAKAVRTEQRRHTREQEAHAMQELLHDPGSNPDWETLRPVLDTAMHELNEADREVILLRYFENRPHADIGEQFGLSENAARMRVERALEKLRTVLSRRGVTTTAVALSAAVSANAVAVGPAGLAATLSTAALTGTTLTTTKAIAMTTVQKTLITAIVAASLVTPMVVGHQAQARLHEQDEALRQRADQMAQLLTDNQRLSNLLAQAPPSNDQFSELLRLRGEVGRLRADLQELKQPKPASPSSRADVLASMAQFHAERVSQLKHLLETNPSEKIPELKFLTDSEWLWLSQKSNFDSEEGHRKAMSITRTTAEGHIFHDVLQPALQQYIKDINGQFPADIAQLIPWFKTPLEDVILQRWTVVPKSLLAPDLQKQLTEDWFITQKAPVNAALDQRYLQGVNETKLFADGPPHWWVLLH